METYAQYRIVVSPHVASLIEKEWKKYNKEMMRPVGFADLPSEFRVEGVITIERLKFIRNLDMCIVPNPSYRYQESIIIDKQEYAPRRPDPECIYKEMVEVTIDVWQEIDL